jgi:hypothetical protein
LSQSARIQPGRITKLKENVKYDDKLHKRLSLSAREYRQKRVSETRKQIRHITLCSSFSRFKLAPEILNYSKDQQDEWKIKGTREAVRNGFFSTFLDIIKHCEEIRTNLMNDGKTMKDQEMCRANNLMITAIEAGNMDTILLLCYLRHQMCRYYLKVAAENGNVDLMKFILEPKSISDYWLKTNNIDFPGQKDIKSCFEPKSIKTRNYMKNVYDIAIRNDDVDLYRFLHGKGIERTNSINHYAKNSVKHGSKIFFYLTRSYRCCSSRSDLYKCIENCIKFDNFIVFDYLLTHYDCFAGLSESERDHKLRCFLHMINFFRNEDCPQMLMYRRLFDMVTDRSRLSSLYWNRTQLGSQFDMNLKQIKDLWSLSVPLPNDFTKTVLRNWSCNVIPFLIQHDLIRTEEEYKLFFDLLMKSHEDYVVEVFDMISRSPNPDRYAEAYIDYDLPAIISDKEILDFSRIALLHGIFIRFPRYWEKILDLMNDKNRKYFSNSFIRN